MRKLIFPLLTALPFMALSQASDTAFLATAQKNTINAYANFIGVHSQLLSGTEYKQPKFNDREHPFYAENDWVTGAVEYNGQRYEGISLLYELTSDNLILEHLTSGKEIQLIKARVSAFELGPRKFVHLNASENPGLSQTGFFEIAHDGPSRVLVRHMKMLEERIEINQMVVYYPYKQRVFVKKGNDYHRVSKRGDLVKLFADQKQQIRMFIREKQIVFPKNDARPFAQVAEYYDTLTDSK